MNPLPVPDSRHLLAAQGWLELGAPLEADAELDCIAPELRSHPAVLLLRWQVYARLRRWDGALDIGTALTKLLPNNPASWVNRAFALHELHRTAEAQKQLLDVIDRFPTIATMRYNLACYACQLGDLKAAQDWLAQAFAIDDSDALKQEALDDPDLDPLWTEEQRDHD